MPSNPIRNAKEIRNVKGTTLGKIGIHGPRVHDHYGIPGRKTGRQEKKDNVVSFDLKAKDWTDVKIRFLKDSIVGVGIQDKEQCIP